MENHEHLCLQDSGAGSVPSKTPRKRRSRLVFKILLSLFPLAMGVMAMEGLLYTLEYTPLPYTYVGEYEFDPQSPNFVADPHIGWRMHPGREFRWNILDRVFHFFSSPDGFRARSLTVSPEEQKAARRIVVVGDSFMWGYGVEFEEMMSHLVESRFKDCKVTNLAQPAFALDQIWQTLRRWGLKHKPDLVIVGLYTNDFERVFDACRLPERVTKPRYKLEEGKLVLQTEDDQPSWLIKVLEHKSRVYSLLRKVKRRLGKVHGTGSWWELNKAFLDAIREDCARAGVPVLFLHFPCLDGHAFPALNTYMKENKENYIDFVEVWGGPREDLYFVEDPHLNVSGHRFVADTVIKWIRENLQWPAEAE